MTAYICNEFSEESSPANHKPASLTDPTPRHGMTDYQTYREALSLIRYGLTRPSQVEAFDFLADIYKKAPLTLKAVFVMALISSLTRLHMIIAEYESSSRKGEL